MLNITCSFCGETKPETDYAMRNKTGKRLTYAELTGKAMTTTPA